MLASAGAAYPADKEGEEYCYGANETRVQDEALKQGGIRTRRCRRVIGGLGGCVDGGYPTPGRSAGAERNAR